jgi:isocitrate lyase
MVNTNEMETMVDQEIADFQKEVAEVEAWFKSERYATVKRTYTAQHVVSLRSRVKQVRELGQDSLNEVACRMCWLLLCSRFGRGTARPKHMFPQTYAADGQAKKMWKLLQEHKKNGTCSWTFGALDPVQVLLAFQFRVLTLL